MKTDESIITGLVSSTRAFLQSEKMSDRFILKTDGRILIVRKGEINWLESETNYVRLYLRNESHTVRISMSKLEGELDPLAFLRVNRSAIVNMDFILELKPWLRGNWRVYLRDGTELPMSRDTLQRLYALLSGPLGVRTHNE